MTQDTRTWLAKLVGARPRNLSATGAKITLTDALESLFKIAGAEQLRQQLPPTQLSSSASSTPTPTTHVMHRTASHSSTTTLDQVTRPHSSYGRSSELSSFAYNATNPNSSHSRGSLARSSVSGGSSNAPASKLTVKKLLKATISARRTDTPSSEPALAKHSHGPGRGRLTIKAPPPSCVPESV